MRAALLGFIGTTFLAACAVQSNTDEYASAASLSSFCDRLPRDFYRNLEKHPVSNDWFEVYAMDDDIWAIYEPFQWQEVISYLIVGEDSALLFDSGNGLADIRAIVTRLTDKPIAVLNSHSHIDHVGGNYQFDTIYSVATPFSIARSRGLSNDQVLLEASPEALCKPLPAGVDAATHRLRPYSISRTLSDGDTIDLGNRKLTAIQIPGHTDDSIALLEKKTGALWSGDSFYEGPIWLFAAETDLLAYKNSVARLATLASTLTRVYPAHNTARAEPVRLIELKSALNGVLTGKHVADETVDGNQEFRFERFSLLIRADLLSELEGN